MTMKPLSGLTKAAALAAVIAVPGHAFAANGSSDGNRYYLQRYYQGDISAAQAYLEGVLSRGLWGKRRSDQLIILDVRDATEYKRGHPRGAFHFPYPRIYRQCVNDARPEDGGGCTEGTVVSYSQDPEELFLMVEKRFRNRDQRLATLCRTGFRSVLAGNILANPAQVICDLKYSGNDDEYQACQDIYDGRGFNRVYNIWQGFVGQPLAGIVSAGGERLVVGDPQTPKKVNLDDGSEAAGFLAYDLDVDNDGGITADDKDGWRYHQTLPYVTRMLPWLKNRAVDAMGYYDLP